MSLLDDNLFERLSNPVDYESLSDLTTSDSKFNFCTDCCIYMTPSGMEYSCPECGNTVVNEPDRGKDLDDAGGRSIKITTGANKGKTRNGTVDYAKTQKKSITDRLMKKHAKYTLGPKFSKDVLNAAAEQYNRNQKYIREDCVDSEGVVVGQKKFVHRGDLRDEILCTLIYYEGVRAGKKRKEKDIAILMDREVHGFARGKDMVLEWQARGWIELPDDDDPIAGFIDRYMEALDIDKPVYNQFVADMVMLSEKHNICMGSNASSKIVGAIWILVEKCKLKITIQELEKACDNTKKNTFMKFYNSVFSSITVFAEVFRRHNVPLK